MVTHLQQGSQGTAPGVVEAVKALQAEAGCSRLCAQQDLQCWAAAISVLGLEVHGVIDRV